MEHEATALSYHPLNTIKADQLEHKSKAPSCIKHNQLNHNAFNTVMAGQSHNFHFFNKLFEGAKINPKKGDAKRNSLNISIEDRL